MDPITPIIGDIVIGLVTNGLTSVIARRLNQGKAALQPILEKAAKATATNVEWHGNPGDIEIVRSFLLSPEVEEIVFQIYGTCSAKIPGEEPTQQSDLEAIRQVFTHLFFLHTGLDEDRFGNSAKTLIDALIQNCEYTLNAAIDEGTLSAHEAKAAFRQLVLLDKLVAIEKNLEFLTRSHKPAIPEILRFEEQYREQVGSRHGYITPSNFDTTQRLPIDNLYVPPHFIPSLKKKREEPKPIQLTDFLSGIYRAVILGNPGGGMSST